LITNRGSLRRQVVIDRSAAEVWDLVGDPARVDRWFPGIESLRGTEAERELTLHSGVVIADTIVTLDPLQRRLQHAMRSTLWRRHLGTIDVVELGPNRCLVLYGTDADPPAMALVLAGVTGAALAELARTLEAIP
jgi:hypothetical protein